MINFLGKTVLHVRHTIAAPSTRQLLFLQIPSLISLNFISTAANYTSFAVSYLVNSCGLSPESALRASKHVKFETPDKPDSVIAFLHNRGFSKIQISQVIKHLPTVLLSDPEKTLLPKFEFLKSKGISSPELVKIICGYPSILKMSMENQLMPYFEMLKDMLKSDERTIYAIKRWAQLLGYDHKTCVIPNINTLRQNGVRDANIATFLHRHPRMFFTKPDRLREVVEEVKKMGFNPLTFTFLEAVRVSRQMSKLTWQTKIDIYKKWGWSKEQILMAFRFNPLLMILSENKIMANMDYFVNVMELDSSFISERPALLAYSLKKRILPRGTVAQALLSKGLVKCTSLTTLFACNEKLFLERFVNRYQKEIPQLFTLYTEKLEMSGQLGNE